MTRNRIKSNKMKVWLSYPISEKTPIYGNGLGFMRKAVNELTKGASCNTEWWQMPNHIGTHLDAPRHFFNNGATIDVYPVDFWHFTKPFLIEILLESSEWIGNNKKFSQVPKDTDLLLIKTGFYKYRSERIYWEDNPGLSPELAIWLRKNRSKIRAVGIDFISISRWQDRVKGREAHKRFLSPNGPGNPILLIEDMDLSCVNEVSCINEVWVFPIRVENADGAPCTVIAEVEN